VSIDDIGVTAQQLREMADAVAARYPAAVLVKNQVGNLSVVNAGEYLGFLDLRFGGVTFFEDNDSAETGGES
jgi:hypothetical protein